MGGITSEAFAGSDTVGFSEIGRSSSLISGVTVEVIWRSKPRSGLIVESVRLGPEDGVGATGAVVLEKFEGVALGRLTL